MSTLSLSRLLHDGRVQHPLGLARLAGVVAVDVAGAQPLADDHGATTRSSQPTTAKIRCRADQPATRSVVVQSFVVMAA